MKKVIFIKKDDITGDREEVSKNTVWDALTCVFTAPEQVLESLLINNGENYSVQAGSAVFTTESVGGSYVEATNQ